MIEGVLIHLQVTGYGEGDLSIVREQMRGHRRQVGRQGTTEDTSYHANRVSGIVYDQRAVLSGRGIAVNIEQQSLCGEWES